MCAYRRESSSLHALHLIVRVHPRNMLADECAVVVEDEAEVDDRLEIRAAVDRTDRQVQVERVAQGGEQRLAAEEEKKKGERAASMRESPHPSASSTRVLSCRPLS